MCGRYTLSKKQLRVVKQMPYDELVLFLTERFNVAPTQDVPIIRIRAAVERQDGPRNATVSTLVCDNVRWGLQPPWSKAPIINAQCEGILKKPTFRQSVLERRCLIPADGFYEWRGKTPFHFTLPGGEPFYFAGITDDWKGRDPASRDAASSSTSPIECCCIITTAANEVVAPFHKRMPFILRAEDCDPWLDPGSSPAQLEELLQRPSGSTLSAKAVAPLVPDGVPKVARPVQGELL